jgi:hypothetical protein
MSDTRVSVTHKFDIAGHEGYLTLLLAALLGKTRSILFSHSECEAVPHGRCHLVKEDLK